jgi:small subunit ribosomal protein S18
MIGASTYKFSPLAVVKGAPSRSISYHGHIEDEKLARNVSPSIHHVAICLSTLLLAVQVLDCDDPDRPVLLSSNPYSKEDRKCILCRYNIQLNYKNPRLLQVGIPRSVLGRRSSYYDCALGFQQFVSSFSGRVYERHITGLCTEQYENLLRTIYMSRRAGYMPVMVKEPKFLRDPRLFDPLRPARPHSFA